MDGGQKKLRMGFLMARGILDSRGRSPHPSSHAPEWWGECPHEPRMPAIVMMAGGQEETAMSRGQHHDDERFPERDNPAIGVHVPSLGPTLVFATVNTKDRTPWLANDRVHTALRALWLSSRAWMVGTYVVMPDHVHFIAAPGEPDTEFEVWVK
jgi:hypothetical protein